jgi:Divergent InlB B-repeat domain
MSQTYRSLHCLWVMSAALLLAACDGGGAPPEYTVAGRVSGLSAAGLVLQNDGEDLTVPAVASSFAFASHIPSGARYNVIIAAQPAGLICTVTQGSGTDIQATVTTVKVSCNALTYTIAGSVSGLSAGGLVLQNNGADDLAVAANATAFQFSMPVAGGGGYSVVPSAQPAGLTCTVSNGVGSKVSADIDNIHVACSPVTLLVGGTVTGLTGTGLVLQDNATDNLVIAANATSFQFPNPIAYGSGYAVTVSSQPAGQTCSVVNGTSTATINVAHIAVSCAAIPRHTLSASSGANGSIAPAGSVSVNSGASQGFVATPDSGYGINQWLVDGAVVQNGGSVYTLSNVTANHTVEVTFAQATLTPSVAGLALAVNDTGMNAALTGAARQITLTNSGSIAATNLSISYAAWPVGTTASSTCGSTLAPSAVCTITITPGATATAGAGGAACTTGITPVPGVISIGSADAPSSSVNVEILSYGCIYQGGYVFAVDDTTPVIGSIGGKVAALSDQSASIGWMSSPFSSIYGIAETSTTSSPAPSSGALAGMTSCNGSTDGACDSNDLELFLAGTSPTQFAAGLCEEALFGYSDWYLPAICEMGYNDSGGSNAGCGVQSSPTLQNIQSNLVDLGVTGAPSGPYWSSTEYSASPQYGGWLQTFAPNGSSQQSVGGKSTQFAARCVRAIND